MTQIAVKLGNKLRQTRKHQNLTQEKLAEMADLNLSFLSEIERGLANPTLDTLDKLSKALNLSVAELLTFEIDLVPKNVRNKQLLAILLEYSERINGLYEKNTK